jgi:SAM-dependent methyltransferase
MTKDKVYSFWNVQSCGESQYLPDTSRTGYQSEAGVRYDLEPYILEFAQFDQFAGKKVLEIGVGLGSDHQRYAEAGAQLFGIDLTDRAIAHTAKRLKCFGLNSKLSVGDAEQLTFEDESFDLVYSWGVLHHSPDTPKAIAEVCRVLKRGGRAKIMIYHKWSMVGLMLWIRYALLMGQLLTRLSTIYGRFLESPGTKAYSASEATRLFAGFSETNIRTVLTHGDLLSSDAGQRHQGALLGVARKIWPRWFIRRFIPKSGLFMLIDATK